MGGRHFGRIIAVKARKHLTGTIMSVVMSYTLVGLDDGQDTWLLLKAVLVSRWVDSGSQRGRSGRLLRSAVRAAASRSAVFGER
jgi:hypothetical protein